MRSRKYWTLVAALAIICAACSTSAGDVAIATDSPDQTAATAQQAEQEPATDAASQDQAASEPTAAPTVAPTATPEPTPTPEPEAEPLIDGAASIRSTTPIEGAGMTPTFSWEALDGDVNYFLVVRDEAGAPYWSWSGAEAEVSMHAGGPTIAEGYSWSVSAFGADGSFVAISPSLDIAP